MNYQDAHDFKAATFELVKKQVSLYRTATVVLSSLLTVSVISTMFAIKISHVEPYLVSVDKRTGEIALPQKLQVKNFKPSKMMIRHFAANFITNYESYSSQNFKKPYFDVLSQTSREMQQRYKRRFSKDSAVNPIKVLGRNKYQTVKIHSISELDIKNTLDIRYTTIIKENATDNVLGEHEHRAIIKWEINNDNRKLSDWDANPIGFTVNYLDIQTIK